MTTHDLSTESSPDPLPASTQNALSGAKTPVGPNIAAGRAFVTCRIQARRQPDGVTDPVVEGKPAKRRLEDYSFFSSSTLI